MASFVSYTDRELDLRHLWHGNLQHHDLEKRPPLEIVRADGCWVYDSEGRRYLDAMAGLWCVNVGYGRREIVDAVTEQMARLPYYPLTQSHPPGAQLAGRLAEPASRGAQPRFFPEQWLRGGGDRAQDGPAVRAASASRAEPLQDHCALPGLPRLYDGSSLGHGAGGAQASIRAAGSRIPARGTAGPLPLHVLRARAGLHAGLCGRVRPGDRMEGPETVAAVILEPTIGGGGVFHAPEGYLERVREICDRYGVLLILDEVITGFGRTGKMFGFEHAGIRPDILTLAKGITSAYLPLAATVATDEIFDAFRSDADDTAKFAQVSTFGGHPCSCAAGLANLEILTRERLWENSERMGTYLADRLRALQSRSIGEVRGRGLLIGLEMVADANRTPMPEPEVVRLQRVIREAGVLVGRNNDTVPGFGNVLTISPPLTLNQEEADAIVAGIGQGLQQL